MIFLLFLVLVWVCMFPTRSSSLRLFTLKSLQNIGETIMFASSRPCSTTFYKKSHFWKIIFDQILPLAMFGNIQGGPSLRVFMSAKSSTHTVKSVLVQPVETMHNTYFTKTSFSNCYLVLSLRDGQSGCCCQINQNICQTTTVCNFVDHPIFTRFATFYAHKSQL